MVLSSINSFICFLFCSVLTAQSQSVSLPLVTPRVVNLSAGDGAFSIERLKTPRHPADQKLNQQPNERSTSLLAVQQEYQPNVVSSFVAHELGGTPNDNSLAVSDDKTILAIQNKYIYAFKPDGSLIFLKTLRAFVSTPQTAVFDPHVIFDPTAKRFIVVMLAGRTYQESQVYLAFSQTSDPSGNWNVYALSGNPANDQTWSDFPSIAITPMEVLLTTNSFFNGSVNNNGFHRSLFWRINKQNGLAGQLLEASIIPNLKFGDQTLFNITPAAEVFSSTESILFLSNKALTGGVDFFTIQLNGDQPIIKKSESIPYAVPRDANQKGTAVKLNTNDCRILDAIQVNEKTYFALNTNSNNTPSVYFGVLSFQNNQPVIKAVIVTDTVDIAFPSLTALEMNGGLVIMMGYLHASSKIYPGSSIVELRDTGAGILVSKPARIKNGDDYFGVWGDYTDITNVPGEPSVLFCGSFGLGAGLLGGGESATIIAKINPAIVTDVEVEPQPEIELYPNPAQVYFHLEVPSGLTGSISIEVVNALQQKLLTTSEKIQRDGNYRFTFDCRNLPAGIYLASVYHNGRWIGTRKFAVNP